MNWRARVRSAAIHSVEQWQEGADAGCDPGRPQPDRVLGLGDQGSEFCGGSREPVPGVIDRASAFTAIVRPLVPLPARVNVGEPARGMLTGSLNARRRISRPCVPRGVSVGHIGPLRLGGIRRLIVTGAEGIRVKCRFRVHGVDCGAVAECALPPVRRMITTPALVQSTPWSGKMPTEAPHLRHAGRALLHDCGRGASPSPALPRALESND